MVEAISKIGHIKRNRFSFKSKAAKYSISRCQFSIDQEVETV